MGLKELRPALMMFVSLMLITGVVYPLLVTLIAQIVFPVQANGSLIRKDETIIGSALIGQNMNEDPRYFWSRPSAINYNPLPSSGSNLGPISDSLRETVDQRQADFEFSNGLFFTPDHMEFASASGLDPHISPIAARVQTERVAVVRGLEHEVVNNLVKQCIEQPQLGFLGQPRVNVLLLNLALDRL